MKLTPDQIQQLYTFTRAHYVGYFVTNGFLSNTIGFAN
jgi:hypothetical protein